MTDKIIVEARASTKFVPFSTKIAKRYYSGEVLLKFIIKANMDKKIWANYNQK